MPNASVLKPAIASYVSPGAVSAVAVRAALAWVSILWFFVGIHRICYRVLQGEIGDIALCRYVQYKTNVLQGYIWFGL